MARAAQRGATAGEIAGMVWEHPLAARARGGFVALFGLVLILSLATWNAADPSFNAASGHVPKNLFGGFGAAFADLGMQSLGLSAWLIALLLVMSGFGRIAERQPHTLRNQRRVRASVGLVGALALAGLLAAPRPPLEWPLSKGLGGFWGDAVLHLLSGGFGLVRLPVPTLLLRTDRHAGGLASELRALPARHAGRLPTLSLRPRPRADRRGRRRPAAHPLPDLPTAAAVPRPSGLRAGRLSRHTRGPGEISCAARYFLP